MLPSTMLVEKNNHICCFQGLQKAKIVFSGLCKHYLNDLVNFSQVVFCKLTYSKCVFWCFM